MAYDLEGIQKAHEQLTRWIIANDDRAKGVAATYVDTERPVLMIGIDPRAGDSLQEVAKATISSLRAIFPGLPIETYSSTITRDACATPRSDCDPVFGGLKMASRNDGTITFATTDNDGTVGYVVSGHVVGNGTGQDVGQPRVTRKVGVVKTNPPLGNRASDSAFAEHTARRIASQQNTIYSGPDATNTVIGKEISANTPVGQAIVMQGGISGRTNGQILAKNLVIRDARGTLTNQVRGDYAAQGGDSGAPIFIDNGGGQVTLVGLHVGREDVGGVLRSFYSPWEGIRAELNLP